MEKSNIEKAKDVFVYAPVGAFGFIRDNAPTFYSMFVSRGRKEVTKTTIVAEEKITNTKHHGQIIAMGSDVVKDKGEKVSAEAKEKGADIAENAVAIASELLSTGTQLFSSLIENLNKKEDDQEVEVNKVDEPQAETDTEKPTSTLTEEDSSSLPAQIASEYEKLSAPEIIEQLDQFSTEELHAIIKYELNYRNRQTIIHAVNHRLLELK